jgi:hypothetical protein
METKMKTMEINNDKLNKKVNLLKEKLNTQEQAMLISNIEISNFLKTQNENIAEIIKSILNCLDCSLENNDIIDSFRVKNNNNKVENIIVCLNSNTKKNEIMKNIKLRSKNRTPLTAMHVYSNLMIHKYLSTINLRSIIKNYYGYQKKCQKNMTSNSHG